MSLKNSNAAGSADVVFAFDPAGQNWFAFGYGPPGANWGPLAGDWGL